jgi:hypothetical protein
MLKIYKNRIVQFNGPSLEIDNIES